MAATNFQQTTNVDIQASLSHILHSLTELRTRINKPPQSTCTEPINTSIPFLSPPPVPSSNPTTNFTPKPTSSSSYPTKCLTYSKMQLVRDQGLCLNCNNIDTPSHRCLVKRIVLVLPDEDLYTEQQPMESFYQPPQSESVNNQHLQPNRAEPSIEDSDLNGDKSQPTDNSEIISQPSNPYSIEIVDPNAAATLDSPNCTVTISAAVGSIHVPPPTNSLLLLGLPIFVPKKNCVYYQSDAYYSTAALYKVLCATLAQSSMWHIEQNWIGAHDMFAEMYRLQLEWSGAPIMFAEMTKLKRERNILIFDPGGNIFDAKVFFITQVVA